MFNKLRGKFSHTDATAHHYGKRHEYNTTPRYVAWQRVMIERIRLRLAQLLAVGT